MDIDDEDDSQRPPFDPAALERELNEKYKANLFHAITYLTSHSGIQIDPTIILKHSHSMFSSKTSSIL
jgi:hypothetical protein